MRGIVFWFSSLCAGILLGSPLAMWSAGCGGSSTPADGGLTCVSPGGPVSGPADSHCTASQATSAVSCGPMPADGGHDHGGMVMDGGMAEEPLPAAVFNAEADDDDCKYHVKWTASTVCQSGDVYFNVTATKKTDGSALQGANPRLEVYLDESHPAPDSNQAATETAPGVYRVGPIRFDAAGRWTVRFHFFADCSDLPPDSPHSHVAFFLQVH